MKKFVALWALAIALLLLGARLSAETPEDRTGADEKPDYTEIQMVVGQGGSDNKNVSVQPSGIYIYEDRTEMLVVWANRDKQSTVIYGGDCVIEVQRDGQWVRYATGDSKALHQYEDEIKGKKIENVLYRLAGFRNMDPENGNLYRATFTCTVRYSSGKEEQCSLWAEFTLCKVDTN